MTDDPRSASEIVSDLERARDLLMARPYQPNPYDRLMTEALNSAEETGRVKERRRWVEWLADIGYGIDFVNDVEPPCTPRDVAEVYQEREPIDLGDLNEGETGADAHKWVIAQNTGWEAQP